MNANKSLYSHIDNLYWDAPFMMTLNSLGFNSLVELDHEQRKRLLFDIKHLIEKYEHIDKSNKYLYDLDE